jgi:hypothetical protein
MADRDLKPPFRFNLSSVVDRLRRLPFAVDGVTITLPFISVTIKPDMLERKVAREVIIRLADRRVLNASECCDGCIDNALASLQEIRSVVVDKQVELADHAEGVLYILLDSIRESIRQFLTFEQKLSRRHHESRDGYFAALEILRAHIHRTLLQIGKIAAMGIPGISSHMRYDEQWQLAAYENPETVQG